MQSRTSDEAAARMAEHDGSGTVVSRQAVEDVDKEADVTPMLVQGEQTGGHEESKDVTSCLTVGPTMIMMTMTMMMGMIAG